MPICPWTDASNRAMRSSEAMASTESKAGDAAAAEKTPAVVAAEAFVREHLAANDASHDYAHIERVRNTALRLAREEGVEDLEVVELAAVLHDIYDHKYSGSETAGPEAALAFCLEHGCGEERSARVAFIIKHVGFSKEIAGGDAPKPEENLDLAVVQDADRLDAIGAIGIARCFTYGGAVRRMRAGVRGAVALTVPSPAEKAPALGRQAREERRGTACQLRKEGRQLIQRQPVRRCRDRPNRVELMLTLCCAHHRCSLQLL